MRILVLLLTLTLAACISAAPNAGGKPKPATENPITGGAIAVTTLDGPLQASPQAVPPSPAKPGSKPVAKPSAKPKPKPDDLGANPATAASKPVVQTPPAPPRVVSTAEKSCLKQGGQWATAGKSGAETCVKQTRDGGKTCNAESDCEGLCLARSGTCSPISPMFGCNDILQDNGVQVTLCID